MKEINEVRELPLDILNMLMAKHQQLIQEFDANHIIVDYPEIKPDFVVDARQQ